MELRDADSRNRIISFFYPPEDKSLLCGQVLTIPSTMKGEKYERTEFYWTRR